jgi:arylsulfatase A-like enzyme
MAVNLPGKESLHRALFYGLLASFPYISSRFPMRRLTPLTLLSLALTLSFFSGSSTSLASQKPNILIIFADDLGYADIGVHGGKAVPTPNIDALAASGVRCTSGYVTSPYCSPSRAGMLTGKAQTRFGHEFNPHVGKESELGLPLDQRTIANVLHEAGYATSLVGKWHLGFDKPHHPNSRGFDEFFGFLVGGHNYQQHPNADPEFQTGHSHNMIYRGDKLQKLDGFLTDIFTDEAISFMDRHQQQPWMLYLAYNAVHTPLEISPTISARLPTDVTDPDRKGYLALLLGLDDAIGRVTDYLRKSGADKNTLIFFVSDNGGSGHKPYLAYNTGVNTPLRGDKGQTLEGGIRVPFIVSWEGHLPAGQIYQHPVSTLDFLPTACAVADVKPASELEGVNLLPYLKGETKSAPHVSLSWRFGPQKAIRQGNWKLVDARDFDAKTQSGWQLYDLSKDISEKNDLAAEFAEKKTELAKMWEAWDSHNIAPRWHGSFIEDPSAPTPPPKKAPASATRAN